ncbi:MAG: hypothetical protein PHI88_03540, partial [Candidatus Pacebacteria bacterium]|nr:hypothetical protein [Candidatus Paceibacterota bacterium]
MYLGVFCKIFLNKNIPVGEDWAIPVSSVQLKNWLISNVYAWSDWSNIFGKRLSYSVALPFQTLGYFLNTTLSIDGYCYWKVLFFFSFLLGGISSYFLLLKYGFKKFPAFLGAMVFTLNPVTFNFVLMGWTYALISIFSLPLILLVLEKYFDTEKKSLIVFLALIYGVLGVMDSQSIIHFMLFIAVYVFIKGDQLNFSPIKQVFIITIPIALIVIALHAHWLLGLFLVHDPYITSAVAPNDILRFALRFSFRDIIRGWGSVFNYQFEYSYPPRLIFFSFLGPLFIILSMLLRKLRKVSIFFLFLFFYPFLMYLFSQYLSAHIPYTNVIRDYGRSFPYMFLSFGYFLGYFLTLAKPKKNFLNICFLLLLLLYIFPFWNGSLYSVKNSTAMGVSSHDIDQRLRFYSFSDDLAKIDSNLNKAKSTKKAIIMPLGYGFIIPDDKRFNGLWASFNDYSSNLLDNIRNIAGFTDTEKQLLSRYNDVFSNNESCKSNIDFFLQELSSNGFFYIALRKNVISAADNLSSADVERCLLLSKHITFINDYERHKLYGINFDTFLPHFYIPQNIIYSPNDIEILPDILSFDDYEIRSAIYLQEEQKLGNSLASLAEIEKLENKEKEKLENRADEIFVKGENKKDIEKILNQVQDDGKGEIFYPYVKHEPESLKWEAALLKEKYDKWQARKEPEKLLEKNLFYASKRINELKEFYADNTDIGADKTEKKQITELYREEMTAALDILENLKLEANEEFVKFWTKYNGTLAGHREKLEELGLVTKESDWEKVFEELERRTEELRVKQDFSKLVYEVDIPKNGNYRLYIKEINGLTDYSLLEERYFEKGKQELVLPIKEISENLLDKNLKIKSYLPNSFYKISLDYRTPTPVSLSVEEGDSREINKINLPPTGDKFESLEFFLKSSPEESNATLKFIGFEGEKPEIKYRNLQVQQIKQPILFLRSKDADNADSKNADNADKKDADEKTWIPKITFVKINPTKYRIKVEGAKEPYTLVFSESFHEGWKIYLKEEQKLGNSLASLAEIEKLEDKEGEQKLENSSRQGGTEIKKLGNWGAEKLGEAAGGITDLFFDNKGYGEEVASYFDGEIKEGTHRNTFLEPATFETWGKEPIAQDNHLLVNGYANSWYIT